MPCLGAPAGGVDVWVVGIDPEVIGMTPAIKVELGRKGPWWSGVPHEAPSLGPVRSKILDWRNQGANPTIICLGHHIFQGLHSLSYLHLPPMLGQDKDY